LRDYYGGGMTKKEIATLSFKVLSLYAFIKVIDKLAYIISFISKNDLSGASRINTIQMAVPALSLLFCGILLWYTAPLLASSIFKETVSEDKPNASLMDIQIVAFSVVGLFLLANSLPFFVRAALWYSMGSFSVKELAGDITAFLLQSILGFWLLLGSRGVVKFISSMRRY
jgi:hypothetical protein